MITKEQKQKVISDFGANDKDTGKTEVQVAILTERIKGLTEHLKSNNKDHATRRGLMRLIGKRSAFLKYLAGKDHARYRDLVSKLGLRK